MQRYYMKLDIGNKELILKITRVIFCGKLADIANIL